jgi:hypothetical protein
MEIIATGFADLSAPLADPECRLRIPLRLVFQDFDPRTLSFVEARPCTDDGPASPLLPEPEVTIQPIGSQQGIPFPVTLKEEGGKPCNTLVFCFALQGAPPDDRIAGRFEAVLTFGSLRSIALRLVLQQPQLGKPIQVLCEPLGLAGGSMLRNALLIVLSCALLGFWYARNEDAGVVGPYEGWILSKAKLSFYAGLVLGFVGLQVQFLRQLVTHLEGWRAFVRFPQLYLDTSLIWLLGKRATTLLLVVANLVIASRILAEWPRSLPKLSEPQLAYWNEATAQEFAGPARIWIPAADSVSVRCGAAPKDRPALGHLPAGTWWRQDLFRGSAPVFGDFTVHMDPGMGPDPIATIPGRSLATLGANAQGLPSAVALAIDRYACGTLGASSPQVRVEEAGPTTLLVSWREEVKKVDLGFAVQGMLQDLQTRNFSAAAACFGNAACKSQLERRLPATGVIDAATLMEIVGQTIESRLASSDQRAVSDGLVVLRVVLARFVERHGEDLRTVDLKRIAADLARIAPRQNEPLAIALMAVSVDLGGSYPTDACLLNDIQPAISTAGGGVYLAYLEAAAAKGLLDDTSPCHAARRDFLKLRAKTMQKMAGFPAAIGRARASAPGATEFLATLQN